MILQKLTPTAACAKDNAPRSATFLATNQQGSALMIVLVIMTITLTMLMAGLILSDAEIGTSKAIEAHETSYYSAESAAQEAMTKLEAELPKHKGPFSANYTTQEDAITVAQTSVTAYRQFANNIETSINATKVNGHPVKVSIQLGQNIGVTSSFRKLNGTCDALGNPILTTGVLQEQQFLSYVNYSLVVTATSGSRTVIISNGEAYTPVVTDTDDVEAQQLPGSAGVITNAAVGSGVMFSGSGTPRSPHSYLLNSSRFDGVPPATTIVPPSIDINGQRTRIKAEITAIANANPSQVITSNATTIDGGVFTSLNPNCKVLKLTKPNVTLHGNFTGVSIISTGNVTLGNSSANFVQDNVATAPTLMSISGALTVNANRGFVQRNVQVASNSMGLNRSGLFSLFETLPISTNSMYYVENTLNFYVELGRWVSSQMPQFYANEIGGLLTTITSCSGIFYANSNISAHFGSRLGVYWPNFKGLLISHNTINSTNNINMELNPTFPQDLDPTLNGYLTQVYRVSEGTQPIPETYTQTIDTTVTLTRNQNPRTVTEK